jgi:iron complex outermembrane receptor protein
LDFALRGGIPSGFGNWGIQANASYYLNYDSEVSYGTGELYDAAGTLGLTEWRTNMLFTWDLNDWFASVNWDYIGEQESQIGAEKWDSWSIFNVQFGYAMADYGTVAIGANNVLNEEPILDDIVGAQVDENQYDNTGRVIFIRYEKEF